VKAALDETSKVGHDVIIHMANDHQL
jgi:hypothetical protein